MSSTYTDYLKYMYKSNKYSEKRLHIFLHQRCPPIGIY